MISGSVSISQTKLEYKNEDDKSIENITINVELRDQGKGDSRNFDIKEIEFSGPEISTKESILA